MQLGHLSPSLLKLMMNQSNIQYVPIIIVSDLLDSFHLGSGVRFHFAGIKNKTPVHSLQ